MRWGAIVFLSCGLAWPTFSRAAEKPQYTVLRAGTPITIDGKLDEPAWIAAPSVGAFQFAWYKAGKKEQTVAKMLWDDEFLYVAYLCQDAHISATRTKRGESVWLDDCVEVFAAPNPDQPENYFNVEMNVNGASLEGHHPEGLGSKSKEKWRAEGLAIATQVAGTLNDDSDTDTYWVLEAKIPFKAYAHVAKHAPPQPGDVWHLNLNRLGGQVNEQFSQWSPGTTPEPQYHAPQDFGRVTFSDVTSPF